jgi:hypothetical protein
MTEAFQAILHRALAWAAFGAVLAVVLAVPDPAQARVFIGFGFPLVVGPPAFYPPPVYAPPPYFPPPYYYPPPQAYYPPPAGYAPGPVSPGPAGPSGQPCYAGGTVCPMERPVASGAGCWCTTAQGRVWGHAG